jgi:putative ABC transport system permease protein
MVSPPSLAQKLLEWFIKDELAEEVLGDLDEKFYQQLSSKSNLKAKLNYWYQVLNYLRPFALKNNKSNSNNMVMYGNYFKVGWRNLTKHKGYSAINISGLAIGLAVSMLIGLWISDELSFDKYNKNYDKIAAVLQNGTFAEGIDTWSSQSYQLGDELRNNYGSYFDHVVMSTFTQSPILSYEETVITKTGSFMEPSAPEILSLEMLSGAYTDFENINSILLSESTAKALFGDEKAIDKDIRIDNRLDVTVVGVYKDLPQNSSFNELLFIAPLELFVNNNRNNLGWVNNWLEVYVQLADNVTLDQASKAIKDAKINNVGEDIARFKPELFLHPMSKWRLYSHFDNGAYAGGYIEYVWLFGIIGVFVLLLACINFMNLSTARSERRAKEVGVRKVIGSQRKQLIGQFFTESLLTVLFAYIISLLLVKLSLPWFNLLADKQIIIDWSNQNLWLLSLITVIVTSLFAGSYPALYLSAFRPIKVLKGTFKSGKSASVARKGLVVVQFTISIALILGTIVVYQQIKYGQNRVLGYDQDNILVIPMKTEEVKENFEIFKRDLLNTNYVSHVTRSETTVTDMYWSDYGLEWHGKDPAMQDNVYRGAVDFEFGETVNWSIQQGRDFNREIASDSSAMILNEAAVAYMGFENPVGEIVRLYDRDFTVIGVVKNMVSQSPFDPVQQTYYIIEPYNRFKYITIRMNPEARLSEAMLGIESIFKNHNSSTPFDFSFVDERLARKFSLETRTGKLAGIFSGLTVFISCLGLFGLATFIAEQRIKEISIRKILGASLPQLWTMLAKDFIVLIILSCAIAIPIAYYLMDSWLQQYEYRIGVQWWVFLLTALGALLITIITISHQTIKASLTNPVDSLGSD